MNKKFLSAVLFGALMVSSTGTFVSCKDYDDDVTELWDAINGQKTDLTAKVTAVEASIASLQTAQTALDAKIAEAKTAAEKAALEAQKAAIAAASAELATVKGELESSIAKLQGATEEEMAAIKADVEKTVAAIAEVDGKVIALQAFQSTTEETLKSLAEADKALAGTLATLDAEVKANAVEIGKNKAAIEAQKKALEDYIASNDAAVEANKGEIEDILVALGKQQEILDGLKAFDVAETQQAIEDLQTETGKLSEKISTIDNKLEVLSAAIYKGVTHVSLMAGLSGTEGAFNWNLGLLSAEAVRTWTFGDKLTGAVSFEKGARSTFTQNFLIRVSPTDAVISAENIKLINSQGADMEGMVSVSDVKPYTGLLTRGISANGLWEVSVEMNKEYDAEAFKAATQAKDENGNYPKDPKYILYAVSLNTTLDAEKGTYSRNVVSEYNLTFEQDGAEAVRSLGFTVDSKDVAEIHNRAQQSEETQTKTPTEYVWNTDAEDFSEPIFDDKNEKCNTEEGDDRQDKDILPVTLKKAFTVQLDDATMEAATAFYIVLDKDRAVSSDDSEIEAWNAAEKNIKGINTVYNVEATKGKAEILIDSNVKDVYGFRVYAVNHDGSLVDPDGKAFYVLTGDAAEELNAYSVEKTWTANGKSEISMVPVADGVFGDWLNNVATVNYVASEVDTVAYGSKTPVKAFTIKYAAKEDGTQNEFSNSTKAADVKFITIATTSGAEDYWYDDAKTYSRTLEFKNARGQVLKTLTVNFKKVLPTFPATFQAKVNQLNAEGTLNAFMLPIESGAKGEKDLVSSFNGLKDATDTYDENFIFTFAAAVNNGGEVEDLEVKYDGTNKYKFNVTENFINNETKHAVTVEYNFGKISSKLGDVKDYTVKGGEFKNIIFSCLAEINTYAWATAPSLTYAQADGTTLFSNIKVTNTRDGKYTTTLDQLMTVAKDNMIADLSNATFELWSQVAKDGAIKEGSKNEYFTPNYAADIKYTVKENGKDVEKTDGKGIKFTPNSEAQNPEATVYSTLIIKAKDYFGHDAVIEIKNVEVKKR